MVGRWVRIGLVGLLTAGCSEGDINSSPFGDPNTLPGDSGDGGSTTGMTTGVTAITTDPSGVTGDSITESGPVDTTGNEGSTTSEVAEGSSSSGWDPFGDSSSGGSSSTGMTIECGDGVAEGDEACDGDDLAGMGCVDVGAFEGGVLACDAACAFDTTGCLVGGDPVQVCETINLPIPDAGAPVNTTVTVPDGGTVADVMVSVDITHTWIGDLTIDVQHAGSTVRVYDEECGNNDNMSLWFDDAGGVINCLASTSGAATSPSQPLSAFDGSAAGGDWTFVFQDNASQDTGAVTEVCVEVAF